MNYVKKGGDKEDGGSFYSYVGAEKDSSCFFFPSSRFHFLSLYLALHYLGRERVFLPATETDPFFSYLEQSSLFRFEKIPVDSLGRVKVDHLKAEVSSDSCIFLRWADPLLGVIQPMEEIAKISEEKGIYLHVDVSAVLGKIPFRFSGIAIDFLSFSLPSVCESGLSVLFWKKQTPYFPFWKEPVEPKVISKALPEMEKIFSYQDSFLLEIPRLRSFLIKEIQKRMPTIEIWGDSSLQLSDVVVMTIPGVHREALSTFLKEKEPSFSFLSDNPELSLALLSCGKDIFSANSTISWVLPRDVNKEMLVKEIGVFIETVQYLQSVSQGIEKGL